MCDFNVSNVVKLEHIEILPDICQNETEVTTAIESNQFKCTLCPLQFNDKQKFHSHVREHFKPITCIECNKTLIGDKQYSYHEKHVHGRTTLPTIGLTEERPQRKAAATFKDVFIKNDILDDNDTFDFVEIVTTNVACDICGRLFPDGKSVARHRNTHSNEGKRFFCNVCNSGFNKKTNLEFHLRIHTKERPFKCDQCPKSFSHVSGLNCHRRVHSGERPYTCPFCPKRYAHSTDLRRHRRTHGLEEKRFTCTICPKQFYENKFLKSHMKVHQSTTNVNLNTDDSNKSDGCVDEEYVDYEYIHSDSME